MQPLLDAMVLAEPSDIARHVALIEECQYDGTVSNDSTENSVYPSDASVV